MRSTTAIKLAASLLATIFLAPLPAWGAADSFDLFLNRIATFAPIDKNQIRRECPHDRLCAARMIVARMGPAARLESVHHPDTDSIRRVRNRVSISAIHPAPGGVEILEIHIFGRTIVEEIYFNFKSLNNIPDVIVDLKENGGGDFDRMIRTAALFIGARSRALQLSPADGAAPVSVDIPEPTKKLNIGRLRVLVSARTASSAEVLAALLRRYAGAKILGERSVGKDFLYRIIPITHDWRLLLPAEKISIPGESLSNGVVPDGPIPPSLATQLE